MEGDPVLATIPASHRDLLDKNQAVVLATINPDGSPQVTALWFLVDEQGTIWLSLNSSRQKLKNLQRDPRCSLFLFDPASPYRTLEIRGHAELTPDPDYDLAGKVGAKYGADLHNMDQPGQTRFAVRIEPDKVTTYG
jgi:PPOX class probable F420-dependent enzyme